MPNLNDLQNSYVNSLKFFTGATSRKKVDEKKDDEIGAWNRNMFVQEKKLARNMFPITTNIFFLSLLFWTVISILIYYSVSYSLLYSRISQEADLSERCPEVFSKVKDDNLKKIDNYTVGDAGPYILRLQFTQKEDYPPESESLPPIVTAVTPSQFYQIQSLIDHIMEDIKPTQKDLKLIIYDLGLYSTQRMLLEKYCYCEVRDFDYAQYPSHVATVTNFAWRPIVLQLLLQEFGAVMYIEPTTRFKNPNSPNYLRLRGSRSYFLWDPLIFTPVVAYTEKDMFDYFQEKRCTFSDCSMLTAEAIALYRTEETWHELMKPWLKCALNRDCIAPKYAMYSRCFHMRQPRTTGCHRYDMSALSIIVNRAVQYTIDSEKMVSFRLTYTEEIEKTSFPEQPWTYSQILMLVLAPVLIVLAYKYLRKRKSFC
ncbi:hypothetical protein PoB_001696400 [Plakobranchus ocellatus]|uniref:Uncharacterized protein n=1 Tax=Plakobranchus ocellatus TaxID=259542 RepID=A0AAV3Z977_9GAST|nr:hypothetical protein PoB_001696400 [Plakobranchus ocellatus]